MRNKILTILGILIVIVAVAAYFVFDSTVRTKSESLGRNVLFAKGNIPENTIIKADNVNTLFEVRRVPQAEVVPNALEVNAIKETSGGFLDTLMGIFTPNTKIAPESLKSLVDRRLTTTIFKNQQVLASHLTTEPVFKDNERYFAVPTNYIDSVGAEIKKLDYVDLWVNYTDRVRAGQSEKVIGPLRVLMLKDANNQEIKSGGIPKLVIFKMTEEQIKVVSQKISEGSIFLVKYGRIPDNTSATTAPTTVQTAPVTPAPPTTVAPTAPANPTSPPVTNPIKP